MTKKHIAELFFEKEWGSVKYRIHSQAVIDACIGMVKNTDLNPDVFVTAGWLHDLGKNTNEYKRQKESVLKDTHHKLSIPFVVDFFVETNNSDKAFQTLVVDCVANHRSDGQPETIYGRIFQLADKVSLQDKNWLKHKTGEKK